MTISQVLKKKSRSIWNDADVFALPLLFAGFGRNALITFLVRVDNFGADGSLFSRNRAV